MNKRIILPLAKLLLLASCVAVTCGQSWVKVASEGADAGSSPSVAIPAGAVYRFGNSNGWCPNTTVISATTLTVWFANIPCANPPSDVKELDILQTSADQVITVSGKPFTVAGVPSPCLPVSNDVPHAHQSCLLAANAIPVGTDGALLVMAQGNGMSAPVFLQYCQGTICNPPFAWERQNLLVGPYSSLGGPTGGTGVGTLYIFPSAVPVSIIAATGNVRSSTIPAVQ